jgi:hypothetical protein
MESEPKDTNTVGKRMVTVTEACWFALGENFPEFPGKTVNSVKRYASWCMVGNLLLAYFGKFSSKNIVQSTVRDTVPIHFKYQAKKFCLNFFHSALVS